MGIPGDPILCSVTDQTLIVREGHIGRCGVIGVIVGYNLDMIVLPDANATEREVGQKIYPRNATQAGHLRICGAKIDSNCSVEVLGKLY